MALTPEQQTRLAELRAKEGLTAVSTETESSEPPKALTVDQERRLAELRRKEKVSSLQPLVDFGAKLVYPFTRGGEIMSEEFSAGMSQAKAGAAKNASSRTMEQRLEDMKDPDSIGKPLGGALRAIFAPLTGVARAFLREPVEQISRDLGASPEAAFYIGEGTEMTALMFGPVAAKKYVDTAMALPLENESTKTLRDAAEKLRKTATDMKLPVETAAPAASTASTTIPAGAKGASSDLYEARVRSEAVGEITKVAKELAPKLSTNDPGGKRLFRQVADLVDSGEIQIKNLPEIAQKYGISKDEFLRDLVSTVSESGRTLQKFSSLKREINKAFAEVPGIDDILKPIGEPTSMQKVGDTIARVENLRRSLLVTQLATSVRNAASQVGRLTLSTVDDALQNAIIGDIKGNMFKEVVEKQINPLAAAMNRFSPAKRARLDQILESQHAVIEKTRLMSQPVQEITGTQKVANFLNTPNRVQEFFFRKLAFEAKLRQLLGKRYETIDPAAIPEQALRKSVDYALEMTFSAPGKTRAVREFIDAWRKTGLTLINPFPRFAFANALPFIMEHSPLGYLHAVSPTVLRQLASGNPEAFAQAASRATVGSLLFASAWQIRQSEHAGEKWYEIRAGQDPETGEGRVVDARSYAPISTHLFLADTFLHPERLDAQDYAEAAVGLNRIAGTSAAIFQALRGDVDSFGEAARKMAGSYMGSFTVPAKTFKDIYSAVDSEEGIARDARESPLLGPAIRNIPGASQMLPESVSILRNRRLDTPDVAGVPGGIVRQATGISVKRKNLIEREVDRLNIDPITINPRTGVPEADRFIAGAAAPVVEQFGERLIKSKLYQQSSPTRQRLMLAEMFKAAREIGAQKLKAENPKLSVQIQIKGMSKDVTKLIEERQRDTASQRQ